MRSRAGMWFAALQILGCTIGQSQNQSQGCAATCPDGVNAKGVGTPTYGPDGGYRPPMCSLQCNPGFAYCGEGTGCPVDLTSDKANCGACGVACDSCSKGSCQPVETVLSTTGQGSSLGWFQTWLYFATPSGIERVDTSDLSAERVISSAGVASLAVDGLGTYWVTRTDAFSAGTLERSFVGQTGPVTDAPVYARVVADVASLYWLEGVLGTTPSSVSIPVAIRIMSALKNGSGTTELARLAPKDEYEALEWMIDSQIALANGYVYWVLPPRPLMRVPIGGGQVESITTIDARAGIFGDDRDLYFVDVAGQGVRLEANGSAHKVPAVAIATDGESGYFVGHDGLVKRVRWSDHRSFVLAGLQPVLAAAVDDTYVYLLTQTDVRRFKKHFGE